MHWGFQLIEIAAENTQRMIVLWTLYRVSKNRKKTNKTTIPYMYIRNKQGSLSFMVIKRNSLMFVLNNAEVNQPLRSEVTISSQVLK